MFPANGENLIRQYRAKSSLIVLRWGGVETMVDECKPVR